MLGELAIRAATPADAGVWLRLRRACWPDGSGPEHGHDIEECFAGAHCATLGVPTTHWRTMDPATRLRVLRFALLWGDVVLAVVLALQAPPVSPAIQA
jgi:hypothetical protein